MNRNQISLLGVPFNGIGVTPQEENPSQAIRDAGLIDLLKTGKASITDHGDLEIPSFSGIRDEKTRILNLYEWVETSLRLSEKIRDLHSDDSFELVLGGDCGILLGIVGAFVKSGRRLGLVMLDGHADFRSPQASPSGEPADLPLWILTGRDPEVVSNLYGVSPMLNDRDIVIFGCREPDMIDQSSITAYSSLEINRLGIAECLNCGIGALIRRYLDLWVHFDVDVIDPVEMPAVHFPEHGGLTTLETSQLLEGIFKTGKVLGLSLACYHNHSDADGAAAQKLVQMLANVLT
jgi:arginase